MGILVRAEANMQNSESVIARSSAEGNDQNRVISRSIWLGKWFCKDQQGAINEQDDGITSPVHFS